MALTLDELDSHLFKCADIIRDAVDPTDYKEYILPLVYYKTLSDNFETQYERNLENYGENAARNPDRYVTPVVPQGHLWDDIRAIDENVDRALNETFNVITQENPQLEGAFQTDYTEVDALDDDLLKKLINHLSEYDLDRETVPPDLLGNAYRDLLHHLAEREGIKGGHFYTPPQIAKLCVRLVGNFEDGEEFHDPTVGSGGMLIEAANYYRKDQDGDPTRLRFTGQEINPDIAAIARLNFSTHAIDGQIECEDSLLNPQFTDGDELKWFDYVLSNFPFSMSWPKDELKDDPYGRFDWHERLPRADRGDYAFIMHIVNQLKHPGHDGTGGKAAIVIPHGVLFRTNEKEYRKHMLENDIVETIVGLPENLFPHMAIPSAILILNTNKPPERKGEVQFIHAMNPDFYEESLTKNRLLDEGITRIAEHARNRISEVGVSRTVSLAEIRDNEFNLNISLYIEGIESRQRWPLNVGISKLDEVSYEGELNLKEKSTLDAILGKLIQNFQDTVLVLGSYQGANKPELIRVKNELKEMGYEAHLFEDIPDFPGQNLSGSVATAMRLVGFCVMVDREPSGHIDEYRIAEKQRTILVRLVPKDGGSTQMIGGAELVDVNYINSFEFCLEPQEKLEEAVEWATEMLEEREEVYSELYDWRE